LRLDCTASLQLLTETPQWRQLTCFSSSANDSVKAFCTIFYTAEYDVQIPSCRKMVIFVTLSPLYEYLSLYNANVTLHVRCLQAVPITS
jgi:hypothetical protein